jgi:hypothetical protein
MPPTPPHDPQEPPERRPVAAFIIVCVAVTLAVAAYAVFSRSRTAPAGPPPSAGGDAASRLGELQRAPYVVYRSTALGAGYGLVTVAPAADPHDRPQATALACERVYAVSSRGVCLNATRGVFTRYQAVPFDAAFAATKPFNLEGTPSRTQVSPSGRRGASTVFVSGDSYAGGSFSTRTTIFDLETGTALGDLEQSAVTKDGALFKAADFNFWGVTFADDERYFATLASGGRIYLVEGSVSGRSMRVLREGIECPSLSPDRTRLAFKARQTDRGLLTWRLHVLDLETLRETALAETRNVDDQAAWFDDRHVMYAVPRQEAGSGSSDVWIAPADGSGTPRRLIEHAASPSVVRP